MFNRKVYLRILVLIVFFVISTGAMNHFIRPKPIVYTSNLTTDLTPNQPVFQKINMAIKPGYGTNSAVIKGGILNSPPELTIEYLGSIDSETYDKEIPRIYKIPIINDVLSLHNPDWTFLGMQSFGLVKGITEQSKNITIQIKATWTPTQEELENFRGKSVIGGTFFFTPSSPYGIFEHPIFIFGTIVIMGFCIVIYNFVIEPILEVRGFFEKKNKEPK